MAGDWWVSVELRHLVALDAVAREGSFRRAAERLGYVQSAISHQIAALETLVGQRLIDRSRGTRPLMLTPAGEVLLAHADAVMAQMRAAQADLSAANGNGNAVGGAAERARRLTRRQALVELRSRRKPRGRRPHHVRSRQRELCHAQLQQPLQVRRAHEGIAKRGAAVEWQRRHDPAVELGDHEPPLRNRALLECGELGERRVVAHAAESQRDRRIVLRAGVDGVAGPLRACSRRMSSIFPCASIRKTSGCCTNIPASSVSNNRCYHVTGYITPHAE